MIRILHLLDGSADFQTQRCVEQLCAHPGHGLAAQARWLGGHGRWRGILGAAASLRRMNDFDIVHTWSREALLAAALAGSPRIVHSPASCLSSSDVRWLRAILACRDVRLAVPTLAMRRALLTAGVSPERCHAIHPGVDFSRIRRARGRQLRMELGLADEDYVLLAAGESTGPAAHTDAVWAAGILHVLNPRYKLLLWGRGPAADTVFSFDRRIQHPGTLVVAEARLGRQVEFEELLSAADLVVNSAVGTTAPLPLLIAMASGLPIVSTVTYTAAEFLEDHHNALLAPARRPRKLAHHILELHEDPALQWRLRDAARTEAYERFPLTRFLEQFRELYRANATDLAQSTP